MKGSNINRRDCFRMAGAGAGLGLVVGMLGAPGVSSAGLLDTARMAKGRKLDPGAGLSVILLGTGTPIPAPDRACSSTLVIAGDRAIMVDTGRGSLVRLAQTGIMDPSLVLFTHYHSDHITDFGEVLVTRTIQGADKILPVIGPPGAKKVVNGLMESYELDYQYRKAHHGDKYSDDGVTAQVTEAEPGVVYDQAGLQITMFEVDHSPVAPAMAYRFDYKGQAVVVSGDTIKVPKMTRMAKDCDILVHEAVNNQMIKLAQRYMDERLYTMSQEMLEYHTPTSEVAEIARDAGVKKLVLTHMVPSPMNHAMERLFTRGMRKIYKGPIKVGSDLMEIKA